MTEVEILMELCVLHEQLADAYNQRINNLEEQNRLLNKALENVIALVETYDRIEAVRLRSLFFGAKS